MFAKLFVSFGAWVLLAIGFVSFLVGDYVCQWVCLSVGSYVCQWVFSVSWELCLSVGLSVGSYVCHGFVCQLGVMFVMGLSVSWELCLSVGLSVSWGLYLVLGLCVCGLLLCEKAF